MEEGKKEEVEVVRVVEESYSSSYSSTLNDDEEISQEVKDRLILREQLH
jgi:hypothetical protein